MNGCTVFRFLYISIDSLYDKKSTYKILTHDKHSLDDTNIAVYYPITCSNDFNYSK